jgi:hypothetical protein
MRRRHAHVFLVPSTRCRTRSALCDRAPRPAAVFRDAVGFFQEAGEACAVGGTVRLSAALHDALAMFGLSGFKSDRAIARRWSRNNDATRVQYKTA